MFGTKRRLEREILAIGALQVDLRKLKSTVDDLQAANKRLELEWVETYDKVRHQLSRMARRGDLAKSNGDDVIVPPDANVEAGMDPISAGIHARRNRTFLGGK